MSDFWKKFFITMGVIFAVIIVIIIALALYIKISKPFGLELENLPQAIIGTDSKTQSTYDHPLLNTQQEIFLENLGVNTKTVPSSISPAQEACAVEKLGQTRVNQIKAGAQITTSDYLKAGNCF